jgi:hypothetical protein
VKRTLQRRYVMPPRASRALCVECSMPAVEFESAEPLTTWRRPVSAGKKSDVCTRGALRRRGGGTEGRIDGSKRGRSAAQPRPGRMAKTRRITEREVAGRAPDWRLRPYERGRRGQHNLARAKGLWASVAITAGKAGVVPEKGYHAPGRDASVKVMSVGVVAKAVCQPVAAARHDRLVGEPVAWCVTGNAAAERRSLPAGLGRTQCPVDRGAGGNRRQSALPCGARRLPPTRPQRRALEGLGRGPCQPRSAGR